MWLTHLSCRPFLEPKPMEQENDRRLHALAGKLANIRQVTNDIHLQASDYSFIDGASESFSNMVGSLRGSSARLVRAARAGHPIFKTSAIVLAIIFVVYLIAKMLW